VSKIFFILLFLALAAYGQMQERIAIINTMDDLDSISITNLAYLTDRLRETAVNVLPAERFGVMTTESIVAFLGSMENTVRVCKESSCLAELGRMVSADYVAQARIGRFNKNLTIKTELYSVRKGNLIGSFTGESKDIAGLRDIINEKAADLFKKMIEESSGKFSAPSFAEGIGGVQIKGTDYEFAGEKRYLASISSDPEGAGLSFNGVPNSRCAKTPCNVELREGSVRIIAALEQYEIADTTVSIKQNNQSIKIRLKANFGVLEIKPAYSDDIGEDERWGLVINGKEAYSWENRLSPNKYKVELSHRCYEAISFEAGINRDKREVFDMASHIKLRKGGLVLSAEQDGEPVSEPVFVNGVQVGETPFSGTVPLCAEVEIGSGREKVDARLRYKEKVEYVHKLPARKPRSVEQTYYYAPKDESFIRLGARWRGGFFSPNGWLPVIGGPGYLTPGLTLNIRITDMINLASEFNYSLLFYKHTYQTIEVPALFRLMLLNKERGDGFYAETGFQWGFPVSYKAARVERDQGLVFGFGFRLFDYSIGIWSIGMRLTYPLTKLDKDGNAAPIIMSIFTLAYDFF